MAAVIIGKCKLISNCIGPVGLSMVLMWHTVYEVASPCHTLSSQFMDPNCHAVHGYLLCVYNFDLFTLLPVTELCDEMTLLLSRIFISSVQLYMVCRAEVLYSTAEYCVHRRRTFTWATRLPVELHQD